MVFPLWPPTMGNPQWEATVGIPRIKNQKSKSQESKVKGSKNPKESSQRVKSQRVKGSIVKTQRVNKSPLIGVNRWDNFLGPPLGGYKDSMCKKLHHL